MPDLVIYAFKSTLTMGDEDDLCFFLPHIFEVQLRCARWEDVASDWWGYPTFTFLPRVAGLPLSLRERNAANAFTRALFAVLARERPLDAACLVQDFAPWVDVMVTLPELVDDLPTHRLSYLLHLAGAYPTGVPELDAWIDRDELYAFVQRAAARRRDVDRRTIEGALDLEYKRPR